jgi:hypothetical protein
MQSNNVFMYHAGGGRVTKSLTPQEIIPFILLRPI